MKHNKIIKLAEIFEIIALGGPSWAIDKKIWDKAEKAVLGGKKKYSKKDGSFYQIVTTVYKNMGGEIKKKNKTAGLFDSLFGESKKQKEERRREEYENFVKQQKEMHDKYSFDFRAILLANRLYEDLKYLFWHLSKNVWSFNDLRPVGLNIVIVGEVDKFNEHIHGGETFTEHNTSGDFAVSIKNKENLPLVVNYKEPANLRILIKWNKLPNHEEIKASPEPEQAYQSWTVTASAPVLGFNYTKTIQGNLRTEGDYSTNAKIITQEVMTQLLQIIEGKYPGYKYSKWK